MARLLTLTQAAAELGVTADNLRHQVHNGRLRAELLGKQYVITELELERYRREQRGNVGRPPTRHKSFRAIYEPDGNRWFIRIVGTRWSTEALRLEDVERMARDLIATHLDAPLDSFELVVGPKQGTTTKWSDIKRAKGVPDEPDAAMIEGARAIREAVDAAANEDAASKRKKGSGGNQVGR